MRPSAVLLLIIALTSCRDPVRVSDLPAPTFVLRPDTVAPGDSFSVVFTLRNPTRQTVTIPSSYGCLFFLRAFRDANPVSVQGLTYFCTTAVRTFEVAPGDSLVAVRRAVAAERTVNGPATPLPAATYRIQTMMNAALPDLEAVLTVVDSSGATP